MPHADITADGPALPVTPDDSITPDGPTAPPAENLARSVVGGLSWAMVQMIFIKGLGFFAQILLAYFLDREQFGQIANALVAYGMLTVVAHFGTNELLMRLGLDARAKVRGAFWLSVLIGGSIALVMVAIAGPVSRFYGSPPVKPLVMWLALTTFFQTLRAVPEAILIAETNFTRATKNEGVVYIVWTLLSILLATPLFHLGAFAPIVSRWPAQVVGFFLHWHAARLPWDLRFSREGWTAFLRAGVVVAAAGFLWQITQMADYMFVGRFGGEAVNGAYYQAFQLSSQTVQLLANNVALLLLSSIARMNDNGPRQLAAILRSDRMLAIVSIPVCVLQAVLAAPGICLVFQPKWFDSIPYLQLLSLAMAPQILGITCIAHLKAQGRFKSYFVLVCGLSALFLLCIGVGTVLRPGLGTCWGMIAYSLIMGPAVAWLSISNLGGTLGQILDLLVRPALACVPAAVLAILAIWPMPHHRVGFVLQILVGTIAFGVAYIFAARYLMPVTFADLLNVTRPYWSRLTSRLPAAIRP